MPTATPAADPRRPHRGANMAPRKPTARSRVSNGNDLLPDIDGRSVVARRYRDICAALASDAGGESRMSEARAQLVRRFAAQSVLAEQIEARLARGEQIELAEHALISSTLVRLASRLGIERKTKDVTPHLREYIEARAEAEDSP
jgi:hypothetical protein